MRRAVILRLALLAVLGLILGGPERALAYTPGAGTLWSDNFQDGDDKGWAFVGLLSKFSVADRGGSKVYLADTGADLFRALPETARRAFVAVPVGTVDLCFELRIAGGAGYEFRADLRPPRDDGDFIRLIVAADGHAELRLVTSTGFTTLDSSAPGLVAAGTPTWIRLRLRPGAGSATNVNLRAWTGGATAEPGAGWDAQGSTPGTESIPTIQRLDITTSQPSGETTVDDIDAFGDKSAGVLSTIKTVWIVEASHLDIGFTAPPDEIEAFAKTHIDQVIANLRSTPGYRWTIEASWQLYRWMERSSPAETQELFDFARAGRISLGAGYVNLHSTVTSREELIRGLSFSRDIARQEGLPVRTYIHDDVPGATWALPEILAKSGVPYFLGGMNCFVGGAVTRPSHADRPFWWEGPDGSRVLSWLTFDSYAEGIALYGLSFFDRLADLHAGLGVGLGEQENLGYAHENLLVMRVFDNHYQGLFVKNLVDQWNATYSTPRLRLASPEEFFDAVQVEIAASGWTIPTYRGDFGSAWTSVIPGTAHTQEDAADARRSLEAAETFTAAASVLGEPHPTSAIDLAWRRILEVDEHSGGGAPWPGLLTPAETDRQSLIHQGYASEAKSNADSALDGSLAALSARVDLPSGGIVVWNAQDVARSAPVSAPLPAGWTIGAFRLIDAARGEEVAYQSDPTAANSIAFVARDVPSRGWRGYRLLPGAPTATGAGGLIVTPTSVENGVYRVTVDPADGSITSILEFASGRELVDSGTAYRFGQSASNTNSDWFWGVAPDVDVPTSASVTTGQAGPAMASLLITRDGTPAASMEIRLWDGLDRVELLNVFDRSRCTFVPEADGSRAWALTLPFSLTNFTFGTESPARLLRPATDGFERAQLNSAMNSLGCVDAEDAVGGLVLASPEAPLSEWGGITNMAAAHRTSRATWMLRVKTVADEALWADQTVGPFDDEPGTSPLHPVTIVLRARPLGMTEAEVRGIGHDFVDPLRAVPVTSGSGALATGGRSLFSVDDADARIVTVKRSTDGASLIARVEDQSGLSRDVNLVSPIIALSSPTTAGLVDEQPLAPLTMTADDVVVPLTAHGTTTLSATPGFSLSPTLLFLRKNVVADGVELWWQDGAPKFRVLRSLRRDLSGDTAIAADALPLRTFTDAGRLSDRVTYFYDVE